MGKLKIIFLDIDGVFNMNNSENVVLWNYKRFKIKLDINKIHLLRTIVEYVYNNECILDMTTSHSWHKYKEEWVDLFNYYFKLDLSNKVECNTRQRGDRGQYVVTKLHEYIKLKPTYIDYIVVDDDDHDITPYVPKDNFIHVDKYKGLQSSDLDIIFRDVEKELK